MLLSGSRIIPATRPQVWNALNNPEVLQRIIPGAKSVRRISETEFHVEAQMKVGPVSAAFQGKITLSDIVPTERYTISGEGKGVAGFAKGQADVRLEDSDDGNTLLSYEAQSSIGGKLAQIGQRLIDATANRMTEEFFANLSETLAPTKVQTPPAAQTAKTMKPATPLVSKIIIAITVAIILSLFVYLLAV